jgi:hypothetical protein
MRGSSKKSTARLVALSLLATTIALGALIVHSLSANVYYNLNLLRLQTAADIAVDAGARYLPGQPQSAIQVAESYAKIFGVLASEIEFAGVSSDRTTLNIRLRRKMPLYVRVSCGSIAEPSNRGQRLGTRAPFDRSSPLRLVGGRSVRPFTFPSPCRAHNRAQSNAAMPLGMDRS